MNVTASSPFTDAPERIAQVIWVLCQTVTERCSLRVRTLSREQVEYIVARLLAARTRFRRVVERVRAGRPPKPRAPRKPRARRVRLKPEPMSDAALNRGFAPPPGWKRWAREDRAAERRAARERAALEAALNPRPVPLWRGLRQHLFGWLCGCAPAIWEFPGSGAACANDLRRLLADPEMKALLASHRCVGDSLRKLCWGLGVERSLLYPAPPVPVAPVMAAAEPTIAVPPGTMSATSPAAGIVAPAARDDPGAAPPSPPMVADTPPLPGASPGARPGRDFFAVD